VKFPAGGIALVGDGYPIINGMKKGRTVEFKAKANDRSSISGFEIINGQTEGDGAGIYAENTPVSIVDNCIHNNVAEGTGGGICIKNDNVFKDVVALNQCLIEHNGIYNNHARNGGGIGTRGNLANSAWGVSGLKPGVIIRQNVIGPGNRAAGVELSYGGGVSVYRLPVSIEGNDIFSNEALQYGGGVGAYNVERDDWSEEAWGAIKLEATGTPGNLKLNQITLSGNRVHQNTAWKGGGVAGLWFSVITYTENIIEENTLKKSADSHGGGIYGSTAGVHRLTKNLIQKNKATSPPDGRGGAIHVSCNAVISFEGDNIVTENEANDYGGAVSLDNADMYSGGGVLNIAKNKVLGEGGKAAGMGGGIYACSSDSTDGGVNTKWQPCNHNNTLLLRRAVVEGNSCPGHGSGVAVEKGFAGVAAVKGNVSIEECIIRNNMSPKGAEGDGVYFSRSSNASADDAFKVTGSLVEGHVGGGTMAGVRISDEFGHSTIESSTVKGNDVGVYELGGLTAKSNYFQRNTKTQLEIIVGITRPNPDFGHGPMGSGPDETPERIDVSTGTDIIGNVFDGGHHTQLGILYKKPAWMKKAAWFSGKEGKNDISGHTVDGMTTNTVHIRAGEDWWGAADGPTRPNGKGSGDKITKEINPDPFSPKRLNNPPPVPSLSPPGPPTFNPPRGPDCTDLSKKRRPRQPGTTQEEIPGTLKVPAPGITPQPTPETTEQPKTPTQTPPQTGQTPAPGQTPTPTPGSTPTTKLKKRPKRGKWLYVGGAVALIALVATTVAFVGLPAISPGNSTTVSSSSSSNSSTGAPDFKILTIVATLSPPNTFFVSNVSINGQHTLTYTWSNSNTCGSFSGSGNTATWFHGDTSNCSHLTPYHPGTITLVVADETGFILTCADPNGSQDSTITCQG
jgi:hypothetical protein